MAAGQAFLVGDIGGTNIRLALWQRDGLKLERRISSASVASFLDFLRLVQCFWQELCEKTGSPPSAISLGVAGVVSANTARGINLPWDVDGGVISKEMGCHVLILNDFEAASWGILALEAQKGLVNGRNVFHVINDGIPQVDRPCVILGAGTGLGESAIIPVNGGHKVLVTEGGHCDFASRTPLELELFVALSHRYGRVSVERLLSGQGLAEIHAFLVSRESGQAFEEVTRWEPAKITSIALSGADELCERALNLFCSIYGAEAGNLFLKYLALGGVYVAGGIVTHILPYFLKSSFFEAFCDKGRLRFLMEAAPVKVVCYDGLGMLGAGYVLACKQFDISSR
ncbi:MAG: glucokinase [Dissulfuribacterales bacterium]